MAPTDGKLLELIKAAPCLALYGILREKEKLKSSGVS